MRIRLCLCRFLACIGLLFGSVSVLAEEVGEEYRCEIGLQLGGGIMWEICTSMFLWNR